MPHITEEIWQTLTQNTDNSLAIQSYPVKQSDKINTELESAFTLLFETIRTVRNLRAEAEIKPNVKVSVILQSENPQEQTILESGSTYIQDLGKVSQLTITDHLVEDNQQAIAGVVGTIQVLIPLSGIVDIERLRDKITKNLSKIDKEAASYESRLNNSGFVKQAPEKIIQATKDSLAEAQKQAEILRERLERLK